MPRFARPAAVPIALLTVAAFAASAGPASAQSTRPAAGRRQARADADPPMIARLRAALAGVDLTDEQKPKVDAILEDAAARARALRAEAAGPQGDRAAVREKLAPLVRDLRDELAAVLTEDQKQKLIGTMPRMGADREKGEKGLGKGRRGKGDPDGPSTRPATMPADAAAAGPGVGDAAPPFTLTRLSGSQVTNKTFAGRPLVLVFASVTSPTLRDRLPQLAAWQTHNRGRAGLLLVYTREAHPADGWASERNSDEHVEVNQAYAPADRQAAAKRLLAAFKTGTLPAPDLALDGMDDAVAGAFGAASDVTVVLSPAGRIVGRQRWCDPSGFNALVDAALKKPTTAPDDDGPEL